ncbi:MAG: diacylglycerol kinase family protein [Firmicutes bacterium]|nr:hypothetical protein [Ezakiella sp.]MDD7762279.1 diacylglycerol kinase family protein [Bacillota bacterium]
MRRYLFILSSKAARGKRLPTEEEIYSSVKSGEVKIVRTSYRGEPTTLAREFANKYKEDAYIYACGGDGTINEVLEGIVGTKAKMGALPCGTGNDFLKTIYPDKSLTDVLLNIDNAVETPLDYIVVNDRYSINVLSVGFDAVVASKVANSPNALRRWGSFAYMLAVFTSLLELRGHELECNFVDIDGINHELNGNFILGTVANCIYYGGGFKVAPYASPQDEILNASMIERVSIFKLIRLLLKYKKGEHLNLDIVHNFNIVSGSIKCKKGLIMANCDGEPFEVERVDFKLGDDKIKFMI